MLPSDPVMLMSVINTRLRDSYSSAEAFFEDIDWSCEKLSRADVEKKLSEAGFVYDPGKNRFV